MANGWAIENRDELDVMAQQRCEAAVQMLKEPIRGDAEEAFDMHPEAWFQKENRPSNAQVQQQLKRLRSQNRPGTKESAETMMALSIKRARKCGTDCIALGGEGIGNWTHMVRDGEACADWARRCRTGEIPPSPFLRDGRVGRNLEFRQSAVREHLRLHRDSDGRQLQMESSDVSDRESETDDGLGQVEVPERARAQAATFLEAMRPSGEESTPDFVRLLQEGAMDEAEDFWR